MILFLRPQEIITLGNRTILGSVHLIIMCEQYYGEA